MIYFLSNEGIFTDTLYVIITKNFIKLSTVKTHGRYMVCNTIHTKLTVLLGSSIHDNQTETSTPVTQSLLCVDEL